METVFDMSTANYTYGVLHDQELRSVKNEDNKFIFRFDIKLLRTIMTKKFMRNTKAASVAI